MAITVIGYITRDTLIFPYPEWHITEELGGALYTVSAIASLTNETVRLICNVGDDIFEQVITFLKQFPNVDVSGIRKVASPHIHCYILFASEYGTQYDEGIEIPISFSQIKPLLDDSDFILVSSMTGFDFELNTLQDIRKTAKCPIYFDYHILALGRDTLGNRFLHRRKDWLSWCISSDHLQFNQFEAELLSGYPMKNEKDVKKFSEMFLSKGVKSVAITLGAEGAFVCWKKSETSTVVIKIPATSIENVVDTTGCGDVFAAGFIIQYLQTQNYESSYRFASQIAGLKCGISGFRGLEEILSQIPKDQNE